MFARFRDIEANVQPICRGPVTLTTGIETGGKDSLKASFDYSS